ncbi:MAG: hypothetical protein FWF96_05280, partial [Kiritimatiellaeota bacterium]|nr:hypothetical protein [Kiritimatiellota bacterium]
MKTILLYTGCAAALMLAGCASETGPAELPNVAVGSPAREPNTTTQYYDGSDYVGLTYAQMNKKFG